MGGGDGGGKIMGWARPIFFREKGWAKREFHDDWGWIIDGERIDGAPVLSQVFQNAQKTLSFLMVNTFEST